jgi:hypothetical protein
MWRKSFEIQFYEKASASDARQETVGEPSRE